MSAMHAFLAVAVLTLAGCSSVASGNDTAKHGDTHDGSGDAIADGSAFAMQPGQSVALADGSALRYERLVNDSRCKPDVQCVWAGNAELAFEWQPTAGAAERFSLHTGKDLQTGKVARSHALGDRTLVLVSVARGPAPEAQLRIDP